MDKAAIHALLADFISVSYRNPEQIIVFRWLCPVPGNEVFQASYRLLLETARQCNCRQWLLDLRRRGPNSPEQDYWVLHEFCPMLEAVFPTKLVYAAYLVAPPALAHYTQEVMPAISNPLKTCYRTAAFIDEGPANTWLIGQRSA